MSTQPMPEPIPVVTGRFDPEHPLPAPEKRARCRALTADGHRCKNLTVGALHLCYSHYRNRRPALPDPERVSVPLLEDRSAIQLMLTQILHGILSRRLDPQEARAALYALHIAALTVPRPPRIPAEDLEPAVHHLGRDHQGFISADGDLAQPPLNPACVAADSDEAARNLMDKPEPPNRVDPEDAAPDPPNPDPTHNLETCPCFTCSDYRDYHAELTRKIQGYNAPRRCRERARTSVAR
jgi:hypothetical protein